MAENSLLKEIIIRAKAEGINEASSDLDVLQVSLDTIGARGSVPTQTLNKLNRAAYGTADAAKQASASLPTLRYALYDVSTTLAMTGAAMTGLTVATASASIVMERQFADVLRTSEAYLDSTGRSATNLRKEFEDLFTSMPVSWKDLTDIGTLAGQLNIAKGDIAEFTELVAQFAATTDVSVEQSATAFGRLSQLLDVPASEFENLGSSILAVGVNSVATESQIIAISTQLASMGNFAGFSADEVFGLSAALASLGTQPELSRGVITRLFTNISTSISAGGDRLEAFGRLAGTTGQDFSQAWGDDAAGALLKLMQGLGAVEDSKAVETLQELGITASRDVPTILRLAQNNEVLAESLRVASDGYRDGTALQEQYSVISSTVAEKITVLINNLQNFIATVGQSSGALGGLIDVAIAVVKAFTGLIDNPITATILGIVGALGAVTGPLLLMGALLVRGTASMIAMKTATAEAAVAMGLYNSQAAAMSVSTTRLTAQTAQAAVGMRAFGVATKAALVGTGIGVALLAVGAAWETLAGTITKASDAQAEFRGSLDGLGAAMAEDTSSGGAAIAVFSRNLSDMSVEQRKVQQDAQNLADVMGSLEDATNGSAAAARNSTLAFGEASVEFVKSQLRVSEEVQKLTQGGTFTNYWTAIGADMDELIGIAAAKGEAGIYEYIKRLEDAYIEGLGGSGLTNGDPVFEFLVDSQSSEQFDLFLSKLEELNPAAQAAANSNVIFGDSIIGVGDASLDAVDGISDLLNELLNIESATLGSENAIFNLGQTLGESGGEFGYFSEEGRIGMAGLIAAMEALNKESGGVASVVVGDFVALRDALIQAGIGGGQAVDFLNSKIAELAGGRAVKSSGRDFSNLFNGWASGANRAARETRGAGSAAREAREEVRTLLDYAGDLAKVWNRAFDIRFSGQQTLDTITSSFIKIREEADAAAKRIRDLNNDIASLASDINIQEYFLSIAIEYGDTKRAAAIEAELAKKRAELADKTADLQTEQNSANKSLVGNSKSAIENRKTITDLVKQYQSHIEALAASGMSQADLARETELLKQDFIAQATQLGYNRSELDLYARAFDDVAIAINRVPRKITVTADPNPALQALNEFAAAAKRAGADAGRGFSDAFRGQVGGALPGPQIVTPPPTPWKSWDAMREYFRQNTFSKLGTNAGQSLWDQLVRSGYSGGGYTGTGGKYEPAGVVHKGEYVIPKHQVNQATGLPYADALGRLSRGVSGQSTYAQGGFVNPPAQGPVHIAPGSIQALANAVSKVLVVDGQVLADSSANVYSNETVMGSF